MTAHLLMIAACGLLGGGAADAARPADSAALASRRTEWTITPLRGQPLLGMISSIDEDGRVQWRGEGREQSASLADLTSLALPLLDAAPSDPAVSSPPHVLYLRDGGRLTGRLESSAAAEPSAKLNLLRADGASLPVALSALTAIRFSPATVPALQEELDKRISQPRPDRDLLLTASDGRPVVLPGILESLDGRGWAFRVGKVVRRGSNDQIYALLLGGVAAAPRPAPAWIEWHNGDRLAAAVRSADATTLRLESPLLGSVETPWSSIHRVRLNSDRLIHLVELEPGVVNARSFFGVAWPVRLIRDRAGSRGETTVGGKSFDRAVLVHADAALTWTLPPGADRLLATAAVAEEARPDGTVVFRVLSGEKVLYDSRTVTGADPPIELDLDVAGLTEVTLQCLSAGDLDLADHAVWADPRIILAPMPAPQAAMD